MNIKESIKIKLEKELSPEFLVIKDETDKHIGHISSESKETHIRITIKSSKFLNLKLLQIHKLIYQILKEEMKQIHALSIKTI